jgi:phosphodiesterase/alkaline phosphatase D-like protein
MRRFLAFALGCLCVALPATLASAQQDRTHNGDELQVVAGPIPEKVTSNSALVWWQTNAPTQSTLIYGTAPEDLRQRVQRPWNTATHEVSLRKLQPSTTYYISIQQPDNSSAAAGQFTTEPAGYAQQNKVRITNGPLFEQIRPDSVTIAWSTNMPSSSLIRYGTDPHKLELTEKAAWAPATHRVILHDLYPDTHYYFMIESSQQSSELQLPSEAQPAAEPGEPSTNFSSTPVQVYAFRTLARGQQAMNIGPVH